MYLNRHKTEKSSTYQGIGPSLVKIPLVASSRKFLPRLAKAKRKFMISRAFITSSSLFLPLLDRSCQRAKWCYFFHLKNKNKQKRTKIFHFSLAPSTTFRAIYPPIDSKETSQRELSTLTVFNSSPPILYHSYYDQAYTPSTKLKLFWSK